MIALLLAARLHMAANRVRSMGWTDFFKALFFGFLGLLFLAALAWGFFRLLREVRAVEIVGGLLVTKLMAMVFMTTFGMIVFSSCLASFATLFFARDLAFLIHSPAPFRSVFVFKSLETAFFSSWMVLLVMAPFFAAYGVVYGLGPGFYLTLSGLSLPFVLVAAFLGVAVSLSLVCVFPSRRVRDAMWLFGSLVGCGVYVMFRWMSPEKLVRADALDDVVQYVALLEAPTAPYLPSWWIARAVTAYVGGRWGELLGFGALLFAAAAAVMGLLALVADKAYYLGWTNSQETPRRRRAVPLGREWSWTPGFLGAPFRAMMGKDGLLFARDPTQWTQLLMLGALAAVYLISVRNLPLDSRFLKSLISFLNIGLSGFVLAAVALRFVYPAVSLEGKSWWVLRSAPLGLGTVLWGKFWAGFGPLAVLGVGLVWASNHLLGVDPFIVKLSNATLLAAAFTLCGMGVGFGALFPRFHVENVAEIESSPGGLLYMVTALFYIGATLALESVLVKRFYLGRQVTWGFEGSWALGGLVFLNLAAFALPFWAGKRHLEAADL
jgi:ABC-2 type transport system permease protein